MFDCFTVVLAAPAMPSMASKATVVSGVAANAYGFAIVTPIVFE